MPTSVQDLLAFTADGEDRESPGPRSPNSVRVVSWNALADQYIPFQVRARPDADWEIFDMDHRHDRIADILQTFSDDRVDFVCLQEVDFKMANLVLTGAPNRYERLLTPTGYGRGDGRVPPTGHGRANTRPDACCIYYKEWDWTLIGQEVVNFDDLAGGTPSSSKFDESFRRGNFGIIAWFKNRQIPDRKIMVCNAHLFWDPEYEYVKLCQIHYLCLRVKSIQSGMGYAVQSEKGVMPILLCGDFNSLPGSSVHRYLSNGVVNPLPALPAGIDANTDSIEIDYSRYNYGKVDWNQNPKIWMKGDKFLECPLQYCYPRFESAYAKCEKGRLVGEEIKFTNSTADFRGVIDYIFYHAPTLSQTKKLLLPRLWNSKKKDETEIPILPDLKWPSDHVAIGAELMFV